MCARTTLIAFLTVRKSFFLTCTDTDEKLISSLWQQDDGLFKSDICVRVCVCAALCAPVCGFFAVQPEPLDYLLLDCIQNIC